MAGHRAKTSAAEIHRVVDSSSLATAMTLCAAATFGSCEAHDYLCNAEAQWTQMWQQRQKLQSPGVEPAKVVFPIPVGLRKCLLLSHPRHTQRAKCFQAHVQYQPPHATLENCFQIAATGALGIVFSGTWAAGRRILNGEPFKHVARNSQENGRAKKKGAELCSWSRAV